MFTISASTLSRLRNRYGSFLTDVVTITRPQPAVFNSSAGKVLSPGTTQIYQGTARIAASTGPETMVLGDELISFRQDDVYIPWSAPMPERDDLITITTSADPELSGRVLRVIDVRVGTMYVTRRLTCTATEPSQTWQA